MDNKEKLQEKYMELQILEQQLKQVQKQIQNIDAQIGEALSIQQQMADWKDVKEGNEILVPLFNGIFFKAKVDDPKSFVVNVGADSVATKNHEEASELIEKQVIELNHYRGDFIRQLNHLAQRAQAVEAELVKISQG